MIGNPAQKDPPMEDQPRLGVVAADVSAKQLKSKTMRD